MSINCLYYHKNLLECMLVIQTECSDKFIDNSLRISQISQWHGHDVHAGSSHMATPSYIYFINNKKCKDNVFKIS